MQSIKSLARRHRSLGIRPIGSIYGLVFIAIFVVGIVASSVVFLFGSRFSKPAASALGNLNPTPRPTASSQAGQLYPVVIQKPAGPPRCDIGLMNADGEPLTVACATCHATRRPNFDNKTAQDLNEFHGSLAISHGTLSCLSCHNSEDYDSLKLADGSRVEFSDVMTLCAQCHGSQMKDYQHGTHGGMTGFWDRTRGPQTKNNCIDCHTPHSPQFPKMMPTFKPRDRFLGKESH